MEGGEIAIQELTLGGKDFPKIEGYRGIHSAYCLMVIYSRGGRTNDGIIVAPTLHGATGLLSSRLRWSSAPWISAWLPAREIERSSYGV